ncbi:MAG: hypothetical protein C0504_18195 [Candidatus Solibacter sp.]|nr:hypothetical protein [Candidatus Solibacter sp.]
MSLKSALFHQPGSLGRRAFGFASIGQALAIGQSGPATAESARTDRAKSAGESPDLPNYFEMVDWMSKSHPPRLSFLNPSFASLETWKARARARFVECLSYAPPAGQVAAERISRVERDGLTIEQVRISTGAPYSIPASVLMPSSRKGRLPGIVAAHCHSGRYVWGREKIVSGENDCEPLRKFRSGAYGRPYAEDLARRGYVVVVIDAFYFGERRLAVESLPGGYVVEHAQPALQSLTEFRQGSEQWLRTVDRICRIHEELTAKSILSAGATWPGLLVWDDRRAVDYLCGRPEVDSSRIGALGLSIGGLRTAHLIAAEPRIKVACIVGWMTEFQAQLRNHVRSHTWMAFVPGLYGWLDLPDLSGLIAPGALMVLQCSRDRLFPMSGMKGAASKLADIFTKAEVPERFRAAFYDVPHSFTPQMQDDAFGWIDKWI